MDTPRRSAEQVAAAAAAMDRARAAGLPDDVLMVMLAARRAWWDGTPLPDTPDLIRVIQHPASKTVDRAVWQVIRRELRQR